MGYINRAFLLKQFENFAARIASIFARKEDIPDMVNQMGINAYAVCSTAAAAAEKGVACQGFVLKTGAEITVRFTNTNTAANPTLNVNNTGAKPIYYRGAAINAGCLAAKHTYTFRYNGTQYEFVGDINTEYTPASLGGGYGTCSTETQIWKTATVQGYEQVTGGIVSIKFYFDVQEGASLGINFSNKKPIYYRGEPIKAGVIKAGDIATFLYYDQYHLIGIDRDENNTYSNFVKSGSGAKAGLVPAPSTTAGTSKYLREDGTWATPPDTNTTYGAATQSANGLMSAADKKKLDGVAEGANKTTLINNFLTNQSGKGAADANTVYALKNEIVDLKTDLDAFIKTVNELNMSLIKTALISFPLETKASAGIALNAYAYEQFTNKPNYPIGKTIVATTIEFITNVAQVTDVGIGSLKNGYIYINTSKAATYNIGIRVYYQ